MENYMDGKSNFEKVIEFHKAFNLTYNSTPTNQISRDVAHLRQTLIEEEKQELFFEMNELSKELSHEKVENIQKNIAKELADLLYVVYGTAVSYGINIDEIFDAVHKSNMSKLGADGKPIYREDGKALKGPNYKKAEIDLKNLTPLDNLL